MGGLIGFALASFFGPGVLASVLGSVLWFALIAGAIFLAVSFFRGRMGGAQPAVATATAGAGPAPADPQQAAYRVNPAGAGGGGALTIVEADFNAFERLLGEIQTAYGRGDVTALGRMTTPEMLSYFANELAENQKSGVRNELSNVKLLQGDLAEAWREPGGEYATVAMRYSIVDAFVELKSGKVYSGSRTETEEVTEIWTFYRRAGTDATQWELSAIQQAG
jgi:predicted lipid-binding transport protein (Tim44 family)